MLKKLSLSNFYLVFLASVTLVPVIPASISAKTAVISDKLLVKTLQSGGYVIYFRHFNTGADYNDQHTLTLGQCATQRQLNAHGASEAISVRNAFVKLNVPVGTVYSSPLCRAWQSADLAFGRHIVVEALKLPPSKIYTDADKEAMRQGLLPLATTLPEQGKNTVIMSHDDNLPTIGGPEVKTEGAAVVLKPLGNNKFEVIAELKFPEWNRLARTSQ